MMTILLGSFRVLQVTGLWIPSHWHSLSSRSLYKLFTILVLFFLYWFVVTGLIELALSPSHAMDSTDDLFTLLTLITDCGKCVNVIISRESIIKMLDILQQDPCLPRDVNEMAIQKKSDRIIWNNTLTYGLLIEISALSCSLGTFFLDIPMGSLPFKAWLPYDYSHGIIYWLTYSQQLIALMISSHICIGYDTMVRGFIMQVSTKLNILKYRMTIVPDTLQLILDNSGDESKNQKLGIERKLIGDCIDYHLIIFKLANIVITTFNVVVFLQYSLSSFIICLNVYTIAHVELFSPEFFKIGLFLCSTSYQIYIFCQAGDEITLVSCSVSDAIYNMDWTTLNTCSIKSLIIIMSRALRPIVFSSGSLITLSRKSFMSVIKLSYSTYNVLQDTSS